MASLIRRYFTSIDPDTGKKIRTMAPKWYGQYTEIVTDGDGTQHQKVRRVPLHENKGQAKSMLAEIVRKITRKAEMARAGIVDPFEDHAKRPLICHIDDWENVLKARGNTDEYVRLKVSRTRKIVKACKFKIISDLSASRVESCLADWRKENARFGIQTSNHYLGAIKQFAKWLVKDRRTAESVVAHLAGGNVKLDRRQHRRDLSDAELIALFGWARQSRPIRRISGPDREMLYMTAVYTGLRASELASMTHDSMDLDGATATSTVEAAYSKRRRKDQVPLHADLIGKLRPWLASIPSGRRLWPGKWAKQKEAGVILKIDLAEARAAWIEQAGDDQVERERREASSFLAYKNEDGDRADFHALRHTFITRLVKAGVKPKDAQALARHSTITLTMDRYAHVGLHDTSIAMEQVPAVGPVSGTGAESLRATGTDGSTCTATCTKLAPKGGSGRKKKPCPSVSPTCPHGSEESSQVLAMAQADTASKNETAEREGMRKRIKTIAQILCFQRHCAP